MIQAGMDRRLIWESDCQCMVPSQTGKHDVMYRVDIARATCDCAAAPQGGKTI